MSGLDETGADKPPTGRRESAKAERRARIVEAARALLRENQGESLSMRTLAARAGVSLATPYNLFGSKRAILVAVLDDIKGFGRAFAGSARRPPLERILRAVALAISFYEEDPAFYRAVWSAILRSDDAQDRRAIFNSKREAFWLALLTDAVAAGDLRDDIDPPALLRALDYAFRAAMLHWVIGELPIERLQAVAAFSYVLILRGAATPAGVRALEAPLKRLRKRAAVR